MSIESPNKSNEVEASNRSKGFYPGELSSDGFLAPGESIEEVISKDVAICERYGVTPRQIGEAIEKILQEGETEKFGLVRQEWRGMQKCPFDNKFEKFSNQDFTITNKSTNDSFSGPGLIVHLLKEHNFFEGNTPYRVDPEAAIKVLFEK